MLVRVYVPVLDNNLSELDIKDLENPNLSKWLDQLWIKHWHLRDENICTRFDRDQNGDRITDQLPRQYIIDFDIAKS